METQSENQDERVASPSYTSALQVTFLGVSLTQLREVFSLEIRVLLFLLAAGTPILQHTVSSERSMVGQSR